MQKHIAFMAKPDFDFNSNVITINRSLIVHILESYDIYLFADSSTVLEVVPNSILNQLLTTHLLRKGMHRMNR